MLQRIQSSYAGLTRVSIDLHKHSREAMDCRVKPGKDGWKERGDSPSPEIRAMREFEQPET
jgi:hypothetical protein